MYTDGGNRKTSGSILAKYSTLEKNTGLSLLWPMLLLVDSVVAFVNFVFARIPLEALGLAKKI